jgi:hypothetical protein
MDDQVGQTDGMTSAERAAYIRGLEYAAQVAATYRRPFKQARTTTDAWEQGWVTLISENIAAAIRKTSPTPNK